MPVTRRTLIGVFAGLVTTAGVAAAAMAQETTPAAGDEYRVATPSGIVRIPRSEWKARPSSYRLGQSFEQSKLIGRQRFPRLVTVFTIHMSDDDRVGKHISPTEYLDMWVEQAGTLTIQVRVDKGRYWVMSRETVLAPASAVLDTSVAKELSDDQLNAAQEMCESEIEQTRFLLTSQF